MILYVFVGLNIVSQCIVCCCFFFFKQKTAYEMRISDWSSDMCSSDLAAMPALYSCSGCEAKLAGELGAERSVSGFVYKISTLILYITLAVRDTASGRLLEESSVSIRGNTDESWRPGMETLLQRYLFKPDRQR